MPAKKIQSPISLLIADANAMVCELLSGAFKGRRSFKVVASAVKMDDFLSIAATTALDVALVGAHLQDGKGSGLRAVQQLRAIRPDTRSIVLLERSEQILIPETFRAGARGVFLRSQHDLDVLCKCVSRVHAGQIWASSAELEQVIEALRRSSPLLLTNAQGTKLLSKQESRIARLISQGMTNREIATHLGLSGHTVKNYLFKIFDKLGISNRVELALYVASREDHIDLELEEMIENPELRRVG
ncbi:MAG TPA: response regulator transcription factor [Terriglobales bacterium]|nr:response regulator transcription factor [Terriglobales bacterium]